MPILTSWGMAAAVVITRARAVSAAAVIFVPIQ